MAPGCEGKAVVIMGVSGSGKSTIGQMLADVLGCCFIDADDYHPESNKDKMKSGIPLSDEDRIPWLETLRGCLKTSIANGETVIMGCSALQQHYREILRSADKNYKPGSGCVVKFVLLNASEEVISSRLEKRYAEGNHFMPAKLLQSQIDLLRVDESEGIIKVDATAEPRILVDMIRSLIVKPHIS